ncbi:MAG TPA: dihydropteroate synthase, partial [Candidatus Competibacteraceae bacterium]|nr:dihydropteroate synthase [Candidatus Competibacteraceae bacterium]
RALRRARELVTAGADIIDIGGESTRPGAPPVTVQEELDRVLPVVEQVARELPVPVSIDTSKPEVMQAALRAGAGMINDIRALQMPGALAIAAGSRAAVCLMHMQGTPATMQVAPHYQDVVAEVKAFLAERIRVCEAAGISRDRILIDPGFGFGKTLEHNLLLLKRLSEFRTLNTVLLVGLSRKATIGRLLGNVLPDERLYGSLAAAVIAAWQGAHILRVHDVRETAQALQVCAAAMQIPTRP